MKQPNKATLRAMQEARAIAKPRFNSAKEIFDKLETKPPRKGRKASSKK